MDNNRKMSKNYLNIFEQNTYIISAQLPYIYMYIYIHTYIFYMFYPSNMNKDIIL